MSNTPAFLDPSRPDVPDLVVSRGVLPFRLPGRAVRGRLVRLGALADTLLSRHPNPEPVSALAGRALALAASLATALKYRGSFSVQAKGDGPVPMLLADCTEAGALRFYARVDRDRFETLPVSDAPPSARDLLGDGYLAFSVDQGSDMDRHQGIVSIEGDTLDEMAAHYFQTSEQHDCWIRLACARDDGGTWQAGGLVLERVAAGGGIEDAEVAAEDIPGDGAPGPATAPSEDWITATTLAATLTDAELLDGSLTPEDLLFRLFHTEGVAVDRARALAYGCRCSRARLASILETFPTEDLDHMMVGPDIVMTCEFCNHDFRFERAAIRGSDASADIASD